MSLIIVRPLHATYAFVDFCQASLPTSSSLFQARNTYPAQLIFICKLHPGSSEVFSVLQYPCEMRLQELHTLFKIWMNQRFTLCHNDVSCVLLYSFVTDFCQLIYFFDCYWSLCWHFHGIGYFNPKILCLSSSGQLKACYFRCKVSIPFPMHAALHELVLDLIHLFITYWLIFFLSFWNSSQSSYWIASYNQENFPALFSDIL